MQAAAGGTDQLLHMPESLLVALLGDEHESPHVVHYVPVDTFGNTFRDHHLPTSIRRGPQLYAALDDAERQQLAVAAQELLQEWNTLRELLRQQVSSQIPGSRTCSTSALQQNSSSHPPPEDPTAQRSLKLFKELLNREGALTSLKPAVLQWLRVHVGALRRMDEAADPTAARRHEEADAAYFAEMDRALSGTLPDALKVPTLARLLHALQEATRTPLR